MLGIRLDPETERELEALARETKRPKSQLARDAIRLYLSRHGKLARAAAQWAAISQAERDDAEIEEILDIARREMDRLD
jgi:RHH-type transcriptional regulator, rel operon repressor / antitoxin RelB